MTVRFLAAMLVAATGLLGVGAAQAGPKWPGLKKWQAQGGGERDAALIAVVEKYAYVPPVPGALLNGEAWFRYLRNTRGVRRDRVTLLRNEEVTKEALEEKAQEAAAEVGPGGTLWLVFVGHGAASADGKEGVLIGADAQQTAKSLYARSVAQSVLLAKLAASKAGRIVAVIDACFSGRSGTGEAIGTGLMPLQLRRATEALDPRTVLLTAARGDEFAGALPGVERPAFSYLVLGGLRGWADEDGNGEVTGAELQSYAAGALRSLLGASRRQTPTVEGVKDAVLGRAWEKGPDLDSMVLDGPRLAAVPSLSGPSGTMPEAPVWKGPSGAALALAADVEAMEARDKAMQAEEGGSAESKLVAWKALAALGGRNPYKAEAEERASGWGLYLRKKPAQDAYRAAVKAEKIGSPAEKRLAWAKLAQIGEENPWQEKAKAQREAWAAYLAKDETLAAAGKVELEKLRRVLRLKSVPQEQKDHLIAAYRLQYGRIDSLTKALDIPVDEGNANASCPDGMVHIKAGGFRMGSVDDDPMRNFSEKKWFRVTTAEYCIDLFEFPNQRGAQPRAGASWDQANSACEGAGKRLCSEAEWERACKGPANLRYPYGDDFDDEKCNTETKGGEKRTISASGAFTRCHSSLGIFDMSGNVAEWTATPTSSGSRAMILKGGAANKPDWAVRCANRGNKPASSTDAFLGFRCCANPRASIGGHEAAPAKGFCANDMVNRVVRAHQGAIRFCFEKALQRAPKLSGRVVLGWTLSAEGRVQDPRVVNSTLNHEGVEGCMVSSIRRWSFQASEGGICEVHYPFVFKGGI